MGLEIACRKFLNLVPLRYVSRSTIVYYEIDEEEAKHSLELVEHGHQEVPNAWVLLDKEEA